MDDVCSICGVHSFEGMVVGRGESEEMFLCPHCAEMAFPGLADMMRRECPICSASMN
jgi:hypothetical protein